jgi:tetratricopeptide (TPR) repeat protein
MNAYAGALSAVAFLLFACATEAAQNVYGTTDAQICYEGATYGPRADALDNCTSAIKKSELTRTDLAATYSNRGILWVARGNLDEALADQNKAISINPSARAYVNRANVHYRRKQYRDALSDYDQAIAMTDGTFATVFYNRALAHHAMGDANAAKADLQKAIALAPENATYRAILTTIE